MNQLARRGGLLLREVGDEIVAYEPTSHRAHCLNPTAAAVLRACDGTRDLAGVVDRVAVELGAPVHIAVVEQALGQLRDAGLLGPAGSVPALRSPARREVVRRAALGAAILVPVVASLVVPPPAEAAASACVSTCTPADEGTPCAGAGLGCQGSPANCVCQSSACVNSADSLPCAF